MRRALITLTTASLCAAGAAAQNVTFRLRPGMLDGPETTVGARYSLELPPARKRSTDPSFPTALSWAANIEGAAALKSASTTEPLARGGADFGFRIQLQRIGACTPENCPSDGAFEFNYGYLLFGLRASGEVGQKAKEVQGSAGISGMYRPLRTQSALWPLVPTLIASLNLTKPLRSELRDSLDAELDAHRRIDLAALWDIRFAQHGLPDWFSRIRLEAEWRHFLESTPDELTSAGVADHGTFIAAGAGYEITGLVPYVRDFFVRWSEGEHPTQREQRKAWLIGLTIEATR